MPRLALLDPAMTFKHAEYMAKQTPGPEAVAHRPGLSAGFCFPGLLAAKNSHCLGARRDPETRHRRLLAAKNSHCLGPGNKTPPICFARYSACLKIIAGSSSASVGILLPPSGSARSSYSVRPSTLDMQNAGHS